MDRTDFELLQSFVAQGDETAFSAIVCRHGSMVRGVCARVLGDPAAADDACQATFVMLAVQAPKLSRRRWRSATLGGWLYRVALNKSIESHRSDRSRRRTEQAFAANRLALAREQAAQAELLAALDQELAALPDRFQAPLVLCHLEGKTQHEAAELLGLSYATVRRRIEQGRALLQSRLARRGFVLAAAAFAASVEKTASAAPIATLPGASELLKAAAAKRLASAAPNGIARLWAAGKLKMAAAAVVGVGVAAGSHFAFRQPPLRQAPAGETVIARRDSSQTPRRSIAQPMFDEQVHQVHENQVDDPKAGPAERPANAAGAFAGRGDRPRTVSQSAGSFQAGELPASEPMAQGSERATHADSAHNQPPAPPHASKDSSTAAEPKVDGVKSNEPVAVVRPATPLVDARPFLGTSRTDRNANLSLHRSPLQSVKRPTRREYAAARRQAIVEARERKAAAARRGAAQPSDEDQPQLKPRPSPTGVVTLFRLDWREGLEQPPASAARKDHGDQAK